MKNKISLIVLNYNGKKHLKEYFCSVFKQTLVPNEIILYDNNSTDGSIEYVTSNFPKVKIVSVKGYNTGIAQGSNIAIKHAHGDLVVFQSNDIRLDENCIRELVRSLQRDQNIAICTSVSVKYKNSNNNRLIIDNAGGIVDIFGFGMQKFPGEDLNAIPEKEEIFFSYGNSFIIRKKLFNKVGGFDKKFFNLTEDIDLSWRLRLMGYKIIYNKKSIVFHKISATLGPLFTRSQKRYWSERHNIRMIIKNHSFKFLIITFPIYLLILFLEMLFFLYLKKFSLIIADIKAIIWNVWLLPDTLSQRKIVQSLKKDNNVNNLFIRTSFKIKLFNILRKDYHWLKDF